MNRRIFSRLLILALTISVAAYAQNAGEWHDPSPHKIQFVTVEEGVQLEVLDWGGSVGMSSYSPDRETPPTSLTASRKN